MEMQDSLFPSFNVVLSIIEREKIMPYEIAFPQLPAGYNAAPVRKGDEASIIVYSG